MPTTVTSKGQVTIPKAVRARLGIRPGDSVVFELDADGRTVLGKVGGSEDPGRFRRLIGSAGPGLSTDEVMALMRGDPDE